MIDEKAEARETGAKGREAGQYPVGRPYGAELITAAAAQTKAEVSRLMEAVVERSNLWSAYQKVVRNGGAPGVDGLAVESFKDWLKVHWPTVKAALLAGQYLPSSNRPFRHQATASDRGAVPIKRCGQPNATCRKVARGWWTWTWRNSSTGSTTTS